MGPLQGKRIVEIASLGPGPFAAMMLADMGADVIRLERPGSGPEVGAGAWMPMNRGRPSVSVDLKNESGRDLALRLCSEADGLIEGFRPGVMERLGLGPGDVLNANPRIVYGRMTGYGQDGPMSAAAGHDINYISLAGALGGIARHGERPLPPLNLVGDFGGGGMLLAFGMVCGMLEATDSHRGQVVDASMVEGAALLTTMIHGFRGAGTWNDEVGTNLLDSGAHFYQVYATADGKHIGVGAIEPQFYAELLRLMELDPADYPQYPRSRWPELTQRFAEIFATKTRDEWSRLLETRDACATAVLSLAEVADHPHNRARGTFLRLNDVLQPAPAPRFSRTPPSVPEPASDPDHDVAGALARWGVNQSELETLRTQGAFG